MEYDEVFESERSHLTAVAFRMLGSIHDAEDAVQDTWIKASATGAGDIRNPAAWLTTILTRICLDRLRTARRRREGISGVEEIAADDVAADERYLRREQVSRALMVVLEQLGPRQRVAYVLHDLFGVPFRQIAVILEISPAGAKQHASRARRGIRRSLGDHDAGSPADDAVVDAFLAAAAGGDMEQMLALLAPGCVRTVAPELVPAGTPTVVSGAESVAGETALFAGRIRARTALFVDGRAAHVIAPGGHLMAVVDIAVENGRVTRIAISRPSASTGFALP